MIILISTDLCFLCVKSEDIEVGIIIAKEVPFTQKDLEHMDMFNNLIQEENARVSAKWQKAHSNKEQDVASAKVINELADDPEMVLQA